MNVPIVEKGIVPIVEIKDEIGVNVSNVENGVNGVNGLNVDTLENIERGS